ncbi:MAG: MFS transporter [Candidatus Hodarchaeales archaeon]|jgi:MFS family permease
MGSNQDQSPINFYLICMMGVIALFSSTMAKNPTLPLFASQLGATEWQLGVIAAIGPIPGIFLSAPSGAIADKWGRVYVIQVSLFFFASAPFLYLFVIEPWQLILVRFFHGIATAMFGPVILSLIASYYSFDRAKRMSLYSSITMIGRVIAPLFAGFLISSGSIFIVYLVCGISGVIALIMGLFFPRDPIFQKRDTESIKEVIDSLWHAIQNRNIFVTSSMEAILFFALGAFETFLPQRMESWGWDPLIIGFVMACQIGIIILLKPFMGIASDKWRRKPLIIIGLLICSCSFLILGYSDDFWIISIGSIVFGMGGATITASTAALVSDFTENYGSAIGTLSSVMDIGHSLGPLVSGFIISGFGFSIAYLTVTLLITSGTILFILLVHSPSVQTT